MSGSFDDDLDAGLIAPASSKEAENRRRQLGVGEFASKQATFTTLREANAARQVEWANGGDVSLLFRATELGGECGEVLNVCKKIERERMGWRGSRATQADLADELADVVICADLLASTEGIDLDAAIIRKFNATSEKVGLPHRLASSASDLSEEDKTAESVAIYRALEEWRSKRSRDATDADDFVAGYRAARGTK